MALQEECLGLQKPFISLRRTPRWFAKLDVMGTLHPGMMPWVGKLGVELGPLFRGGLSQLRYPSQLLIATSQVWDLPVLCHRPSYQS